MSSWEFGWEEEEGEGSWQKVAEMNEHFIDYLTNKKTLVEIKWDVFFIEDLNYFVYTNNCKQYSGNIIKASLDELLGWRKVFKNYSEFSPLIWFSKFYQTSNDGIAGNGSFKWI